MARNPARLWRDCRGTSVLETAVIVPVLVLLVCGAADASLGFAQKLRVQQAADRAVQFALNAGLTTATHTMIQNEAVVSAGVPAANVTVTFWLECNNVVQANFNGTCPSSPPARYVSVAVSDSYSPRFTRLFAASPISLQGFAEGRLQ